MPDVVTLGETMVLFTPMGDGPLRYVHHFEKRIGGAESNVCIGLTRLGHSAGWISRLGDDEFGRYVLSAVRSEGVDVSQVHFDPEHPTAVYFKERRALGSAQVYYYRAGSAASHMTPDDIDPDYIQNAKFLLGSGITPALSATCRDALWRAVEIAKEAGVRFAFDPNVRLKLWSETQARQTLIEFAKEADVLLPGRDEAEFLTGEADPVRAGRLLLQAGPQVVVVKLGAQGALVVTEEGETEVPGFPVEQVVDPVGAGDAFAAGFLAATLEGKSPVEAARLGNACGAFATTVPGDIEGMPERDEVDRLVEGKAGLSDGDVRR